MAAAKKKKKKPVFSSVSRWLLGAGAGGLVLIGVAGGMVLDLVLRPAPKVHPWAAVHTVPHPASPLIRHPAAESVSPSLFTPRTSTTETAQPAPPPASESPMTAFAVPAQVPASRPVLAIVIDDFGLDRVHSLQALTLGGPLTISIMTYADDVAGLAARARAAGDEVLAHVPMEPLDPKQNPGPRALTVTMDDTAIRAAIAADLDRWHGYVGINNHMGSRFTQDPARMAVVMEELKARGLLWLDSRTTIHSAGMAAAKDAGVPFVTRDVFLDDVQTPEAVSDQLKSAIAFAKAHGSAIAIGHPHEVTIAVLQKVLPALAERGVSLVPVTEVLKRRTASASSKAARSGTGPA